MRAPFTPKLIRPVRRRLADESGVTMVVVAVCLVALLGMAAIAIDLSSFWKAQKRAQAAADAGALAASWDLPQNTGAAVTDATTYGKTNYPGATVNVTTNYTGKPNLVKVTVNASSPSFFGKLFGLTSAKISASAVAGAQGTVAQGAIFAYDNGGQGCTNGIDLGTNNLNITGGIESNGFLTVSSNSSTHLSTGTYNPSCPYTSGSSFWTTPPFSNPAQNWPIDYRNSMPACTTTLTGNQTLSASNLSGTYCDTTGTLTVTGSSCAGCTVTFEALQIVFNGSGETLNAPAANGGGYGLLAYQSGTSPMLMSSNSSTLNGAIFAPNAEIDISGNSSGTGFIEGNTVKFGGSNGGGGGGGSSGNGFSITGDGPPVASNGYALTQ